MILEIGGREKHPVKRARLTRRDTTQRPADDNTLQCGVVAARAQMTKLDLADFCVS